MGCGGVVDISNNSCGVGRKAIGVNLRLKLLLYPQFHLSPPGVQNSTAYSLSPLKWTKFPGFESSLEEFSYSVWGFQPLTDEAFDR
jgi:hypothetical protein